METGQIQSDEAAREFIRELRRGVLLADGAMGTLLYSRGASTNESLELLNLTNPEMVERAHLDYLLAGARVIETNTYGANRLRLAEYGLAEKVWDINLRGAKLARSAREVAGEPALVAGAVGPLRAARVGSPGKELSPGEVRALYREQMEALLAGGVDLFVVETHADPKEAVEAIRAAREICRLPVVLEFAFWPVGPTEGVPAGPGRPGLWEEDEDSGGLTTAAGYTPEAVAGYLNALPEGDRPEVIGLNCGGGVVHLLQALTRLKRELCFEVLWSAMPNAGLPRYEGGRLYYAASPAYMASRVSSLIEAGVSLVGGCCGTTPEHIQAMRQALAGISSPAGLFAGTAHAAGRAATRGGTSAHLPAGASTHAEAPKTAPVGTGALPGAGIGTPSPWVRPGPSRAGGRVAGAPPGQERKREAGRTIEIAIGKTQPALGAAGAGPGAGWPAAGQAAGQTFRAKLGRQFIISVELDPPRGSTARKYLEAAQALGRAGADVINVADSPMARVRMGAVAAASLVQWQAGVETIVHFTARDRNLMAIQSDLLGAHAMGLRNVLALTGDPPSLGNVARATPVYDVDSIGLIQVLAALNRGEDVAGNPIGRGTEFTIGCALSPNAEDLAREVERFRRKVAAGVHFAMTQPLYELAPLEHILNELGGGPVPILLGVMPLHSFRHAEYLHNEVPGISIPERIREELARAGDEGLKVGLEQAARLVTEARSLVAGIYVVLSFGKHEPVCDFVRWVRELVTKES